MNNFGPSAIILAAGRSERMKSPKLFLPFLYNKNFLQEITEKYLSWGSREVLVVVNKENLGMIDRELLSHKKINFVINDHVEFGRLYSLQRGLARLSAGQSCFFQNIDNPFLKNDLLNMMFENFQNSDVVIPVFNGMGGHPVLLSSEAIKFILAYRPENSNLRDVIKELNCKRIEINNPDILININTPAEYQHYFNN